MDNHDDTDTERMDADAVLTDVADILKHNLNHQLRQLQTQDTTLLSAGAVLIAVARVLRQTGEEWIRMVVIDEQQTDAIKCAEQCGQRSADLLMPEIRTCISMSDDDEPTPTASPFDIN